MRPKVTIAIPFHNPGKHFEWALKSVFSQTFEDWELILIDDGSTDGSLEFARSIRDRRVTVISDGVCRRVNFRLNEATRCASAAFLFRMDSDDIMCPERVARQYEILSRHPDVLVHSSAYAIDQENRIRGIHQVRRGARFDPARWAIHPTVAGATEWFRANPYNESFVYHRAQDAELWSRTYSTTRFVQIPEPLLFYRNVDAFSYPNYAGSQLGLLCLAYATHETCNFAYVRYCTKSCVRLLAGSLLAKLGWAQWLVNRRRRSISEQELARAESSLRQVADVQICKGDSGTTDLCS
jgi:glycosyltransferase involved in cell wall biosynthesis